MNNIPEKVVFARVESFAARVGAGYTARLKPLTRDEIDLLMADSSKLHETMWLNAVGGNSRAGAGEWGLQAALFHAANEFLLRLMAGVGADADCLFTAREMGASGGMDLASLFDSRAGHGTRTLLLVDIKPFSWVGGEREPREHLQNGLRVALGTLPNIRSGKRIDRLEWVLLRGYHPSQIPATEVTLPQWHHDGDGDSSGFAPPLSALRWWGFIPFRRCEIGVPDEYFVAIGPWGSMENECKSLFESLRKPTKRLPVEDQLPRPLAMVYPAVSGRHLEQELRERVLSTGSKFVPLEILRHRDFLEVALRCEVPLHAKSFLVDSTANAEGVPSNLHKMRRLSGTIPGWKFLGESVDKGVTQFLWISETWTQSSDRSDERAVSLCGEFAALLDKTIF